MLAIGTAHWLEYYHNVRGRKYSHSIIETHHDKMRFITGPNDGFAGLSAANDSKTLHMAFSFHCIKIFFMSLYMLAPILSFLGVIIVFLGQIVGRTEGWTKFDSVYWSFVTASTVGYGDIRPMKKVSKMISIAIALIGIMFTGIIVAVTVNTTKIALEEHGDMGLVERLTETEIPSPE
jgi:voltage-gated potassium channel